MSAQNFAFDTTIGFTLTSEGMSGCLRVKDIKLKLSLKSLNVSKRLENHKDFLFLLFCFLQSSQLILLLLRMKFCFMQYLLIADSNFFVFFCENLLKTYLKYIK